MKKLAIVGSAKDTHAGVPFDDPEFDIWVFNEAPSYEWCKRWTALFQMHEPEIYSGHNVKDPNHWQFLQQKRGKPIYMQELDPRVPDSERYPLEEAEALVGMQYLSSTVSMACALAAVLEYEYIEFHGIELSATEYRSQAECMRFWVGFLIGRLGVENVNHRFTHLHQNIFTAPLYGYEGNFALGAEFFAERAKVLDAEWRAADRFAVHQRKAVENAIAKLETGKVPELVQSYQLAVMACGEIAGALAEAERYQTFGNRYADRGGFELQAAHAQRDGEARRTEMFIALGKAEYVWNIWAQTKGKQAGEQLIALINAVGKLAQDAGHMFGVYRENVSYIGKYDDIVQAGGRVLLEAA